MKGGFHDPALEAEFSARSWKRGVDYFARGCVLFLDPIDERAWEAEIQGSRPDPYSAWLALADEGDEVSLDGECSCPAPPPCKHLAAVLCAVREAAAPGSEEVEEQLFALEQWTEELERPSPAPPDVAPKKRLVYVLSLSEGTPQMPIGLAIEARLANVRKTGALGKTSRLEMRGGLGTGGPGRYATNADRLLWFRLTQLPRVHSRSLYRSQDFERSAEGSALLRDFLATGRCYFETTDAAVLAYGPPRTGRVGWTSDGRGDQRLVVSDGESEAVLEVLPLSPPHYLERDTGRVGPLRLDLPERVASAIVDLPVLDAQTAAALPKALGDTLAHSGVPRPAQRSVQPIDPDELRPRLVLQRGPSQAADSDGLEGAEALLRFDYAQVCVEPGVDAAIVGRVEGDVVLRVERDLNAEASLRRQLLARGFFSRPEEVARMRLPTHEAWESFIHHGQADLRAAGWQIDVSDDFPIELLHVDAWYVDVGSDTPAADWFALELGVEVGGERINILPVVVAAIRSGRLVKDRIRIDGESIVLPLGDGRSVSLPSERLREVLDVLVELYDERLVGGRLQLAAADAARLLALDGIAWTGDRQLRTLARQLARADALPTVNVPHTLKAQLREYQARGLDWLGFLRQHGFGGVLADDMGLGKTVQALAHLLVEKQARRLKQPCLVVAPRSVLRNWVRECERFAPSLSRAIYHGPDRQQVLEGRIPNLVVTTYALLQRDEALRAVEWHIVLLDEAQAIKNPDTKVAEAARALRAQQRLCLTGTPMENNLQELWSLFTFACPGLLGGLESFNANYRRPIEGRGDAGRLAALSARIAPFMLRRTKAQVLTDLPPKTEIVLTVAFETRQRDLYESVRMTMEKKVREELSKRGLARSQIIILDALLKLRQVCCHPGLVNSETARNSRAGSAKTDRLIEMLDELLAEDRRVVIFSQFTGMLDIVAARLQARGVEFARITGKTRKRQEVVDAFQAGAFPVLLVSLKAGGTGINLTRADTVIHYDPWWNPAVEAQATDRAHRIGQERPITVYRLVCEDSVEQRMLDLQERKRNLAESLQRDAEHRSKTGLALEAGDLELLLSPLDGPSAPPRTALDLGG